VCMKGMHPAKIFLPLHLAIKIEAVQAARPEEGVNSFAIGHR